MRRRILGTAAEGPFGPRLRIRQPGVARGAWKEGVSGRGNTTQMGWTTMDIPKKKKKNNNNINININIWELCWEKALLFGDGTKKKSQWTVEIKFQPSVLKKRRKMQSFYRKFHVNPLHHFQTNSPVGILPPECASRCRIGTLIRSSGILAAAFGKIGPSLKLTDETWNNPF